MADHSSFYFFSTSFSLYVRRLPLFNNSDHHHHYHQHPHERFRVGVGVIGNIVALLLYAAPILTFKRVMKERSTGEFSCVPYLTALLNCLIYTWYGSPVISNKWNNLPLFTINGVGAVLECCFLLTFLLFASPTGKKNVYMMVVPVMAFVMGMVVLTCIMKDHHLRKAMVGTFGLVACIAMYGSPLVAVKRVIKTRSVEFMPFSLSLFSFLASSLWTAYGLLSHDVLLAVPNLLGCPLGILQLVVYWMYRRKEQIFLEELPDHLEVAVKQNIEEEEEKEEEAPFKVDIIEENEHAALNMNVDQENNEAVVIVDMEENYDHD